MKVSEPKTAAVAALVAVITAALFLTSCVPAGIAAAFKGGGGGGGKGPSAPTLLGVTPDSGHQPGGRSLVLRGTGFQANAAGTNLVRFGGVPATAITVVDDATLTCALPAGQAGAIEVTVSNANGTAMLTDGFTYFGALKFGGDDRRLNASEASASDLSEARLCCDGRNVYVVWEDQRNGVDQRSVYFNRSIDGGATWLNEDIRLDRDEPRSGNSWNPKICCADRNVYVVWRDNRNGLEDTYFNRSVDGGTTWLASDVRLDTGDPPGASGSFFQAICCEADSVYVVWEDQRGLGGRQDIRLNRSVDAGVTWLTEDVRVDHDSSTAISVQPEICCDGANIYVVWLDTRNDLATNRGDIYFNRSTDGGLSWLPEDRRLDTDSPGSASSWRARICCEGSDVYVVWEDWRSGGAAANADVHLNRSLDGGVTWLSSDVRLDGADDAPGAARSEAPEICCADGNVFVVWEDWRADGTVHNASIRLNRSTDRGASWLDNAQRIDGDALGKAAVDPDVYCEGSNVYVVWAQAQVGLKADIFADYSRDGGASWLSTDQRVDTGDLPGTVTSQVPQVCVKGGVRTYVVWRNVQDLGAGRMAFGVFFNRRVPQ